MCRRQAANELMQTITEETVVIQKTRELCQAILDESDYQDLRRRMDAFMADEKAKNDYDAVMSKGQALQQKQQMALALDASEISEFERQREQLLNNPVARGFLDAQDEMHKLQHTVGEYVSLTLELGRVPNPDDFESGNCGHGCGCKH